MSISRHGLSIGIERIDTQFVITLGLKHGNEFDKIAIYGNKRWQQMAARVGSWFVSGEARYFDDYAAAVAWLND